MQSKNKEGQKESTAKERPSKQQNLHLEIKRKTVGKVSKNQELKNQKRERYAEIRRLEGRNLMVIKHFNLGQKNGNRSKARAVRAWEQFQREHLRVKIQMKRWEYNQDFQKKLRDSQNDKKKLEGMLYFLNRQYEEQLEQHLRNNLQSAQLKQELQLRTFTNCK